MKLTPVRIGTIGISVFCVCSACLVWATPPWLTKDFKDWTLKDASALVVESPWAKVMPLPSTDRPSQMVFEGPPNAGAQSTAAIGNNSTNTATTGANQGSENGNTGRAQVLTPAGLAQSTGAPPLQPTITVIWASALPVRLAELKLRSHGTQPDDAQIHAAEKPREHYVIVVVGLPEPDDLAQVNALASKAALDSHGKAIRCSASDFRKVNDRNIYIFRFPKAATFGLEDREVEFHLTMGRMEIKRKFDLREMVYQGKLAL